MVALNLREVHGEWAQGGSALFLGERARVGASVPHHHDERMRAPPSTFAFPVDFGTVIYSTEPQQIERGGTAQNFWGTTDFIWGRESFRRLEFPLDHL